MTSAGASRDDYGGGLARLVEHCETIGRVTAERRSNALVRLEGEVGCDLARRLVGALASGGRRSSRAL